jgi:predicted tellurium resistance membrane protein TerC
MDLSILVQPESIITMLTLALLDIVLGLVIVFSLDSVIAAVGLADEQVIMVIAIVLAVGVMLLFVNSLSALSRSIRQSRCWRCRSSCLLVCRW